MAPSHPVRLWHFLTHFTLSATLKSLFFPSNGHDYPLNNRHIENKLYQTSSAYKISKPSSVSTLFVQHGSSVLRLIVISPFGNRSPAKTCFTQNTGQYLKTFATYATLIHNNKQVPVCFQYIQFFYQQTHYTILSNIPANQAIATKNPFFPG